MSRRFSVSMSPSLDFVLEENKAFAQIKNALAGNATVTFQVDVDLACDETFYVADKDTGEVRPFVVGGGVPMAVGVVGRWYLGPLLCGWCCCCRWSWWRLCVDGSQAWYFEGGTAHGFTLSAPMHYCWVQCDRECLATSLVCSACAASQRGCALVDFLFFIFQTPPSFSLTDHSGEEGELRAHTPRSARELHPHGANHRATAHLEGSIRKEAS